MTNIKELESTISKLTVAGKGILAADESTGTITKRFQAVGIESTEDNRRAYREMLITSPEFNRYIAGVILFEETLNQNTSQGISFPEALKNMGVLPGIKVDKGLVHLANSLDENITQGLDGLPERLAEYKSKGACFAKWRSVYTISDKTPTSIAIETNAEVLARYAAICQEQGIVPIVEPEVLIDGDHTLARCEEVTEPVLQAVFNALYRHHVKLEFIVLKPSMVISGKACPQKASVNEVAEATVRILRRTVPGAVPTINFLSGGQTSEQATAHLNAMNQLAKLPWNLSFSYARALQDYCMKTWQGQSKNIATAQKAFSKRAMLNSLAAQGKYQESMEKEEISLAS
ncbi:class I fructose-bisphosphate aldolase [Aquicella lusitana]|uniref:Probable fructose-bisphosphate aldolase class 1 n=1 Tax=Aquicella lusitana TaxID=254246 RepID=A0A370H0T1_9COXI|nr:class I fructose-bisphosphate aldolase [Aquicella lusitana]RDI48574.1 fructose-bisphosphate aldolase [Aquicella lusitana]VVC74049.1 Fructose-bisphosphate aldolase class 1 [Aquicella lusitana]